MSGIFVKAAWRNVFRNRRRSIVIISSVAIGVAGSVFIILFMAGMFEQMLNSAIRSMGHIQIQHPEFADNPGVNRSLAKPDDVIAAIEQTNGIEHWTPRIETRGLAQSAVSSAGVMIYGVDAARESLMTNVASRVIEGEYLTGESTYRRKEIIIGTKLADKLAIGVGSRMVLTAQGRIDGSDQTEMTSGAYRVVGVFEMPSASMNESIVYINLVDARTLLNMGDDLSQIAVTLQQSDLLEETQAELEALLGTDQYDVRTWRDGNRIIVQWAEMFDAVIMIWVAIIFLGAAFGIVNTMLMAVFERTREFGILRAVGTSRWALFRMVVYEAFFISAIGSACGFLLIAVLHGVWLRNGLDLSMFAESLASFGSDAVIMPEWRMDFIIQTVIVVFFMGILAAVWPAARAARLQPAETMRGK